MLYWVWKGIGSPGIRIHDLLISDIQKPELWYRPSLTNWTGIKISQNKIRTTELKQLFAVKNNLFWNWCCDYGRE